MKQLDQLRRVLPRPAEGHDRSRCPQDGRAWGLPSARNPALVAMPTVPCPADDHEALRRRLGDLATCSPQGDKQQKNGGDVADEARAVDAEGEHSGPAVTADRGEGDNHGQGHDEHTDPVQRDQHDIQDPAARTRSRRRCSGRRAGQAARRPSGLRPGRAWG